MPDLSPEDFVRLATLFSPETVTSLAFSPDGSLLAVGAGDKIHIFRVPAEAPAAPPQQPANPPGS